MKILAIPTLAIALFASGCAGTGGTSTTQVTDIIANVQAQAEKICAFVPTAATVNALLVQVGVPSIGTGLDIATSICAAIVRRSGASRPSVRGVPIYGKFVSRR